MRINRFAIPGAAGIFFYGRTAAMARRGERNGKMQSEPWREIRALKFPPQRLAEIDRAVEDDLSRADPDAEKLWVAEAQRRADELATGQTKAVPAEKVLKKARSDTSRLER